MFEASTLGALAQVSLLLSGLFATWVAVPGRVVGWLAGFGAGALISAVSFDLLPMAALAAGGLLAMLTDSLMPFAYRRGRNWAGVWTVIGFARSRCCPGEVPVADTAACRGNVEED